MADPRRPDPRAVLDGMRSEMRSGILVAGQAEPCVLVDLTSHFGYPFNNYRSRVHCALVHFLATGYQSL